MVGLIAAVAAGLRVASDLPLLVWLLLGGFFVVVLPVDGFLVPLLCCLLTEFLATFFFSELFGGVGVFWFGDQGLGVSFREESLELPEFSAVMCR